MSHWHAKLIRYGKECSFVISYESKKVHCVSFYAIDATNYNSFYGVIKSAAEECGGKNQDPSDHEGIHVLFGQDFNVVASSTKTSTHFHWVFDGLDLENGFYAFVSNLKKDSLVAPSMAKEMIQLLM